MVKRPPNLLVVMSDEHAPQFSGFGGHPVVQTPNLDRLAATGVHFANAYCASPLCTPSRMSFMTGRHVHRNPGGWDNTSHLSPDVATWAHAVRAAGYDCVLAGKQHFPDPAQLHGFREQLAFDLHAAQAHGQADWSRGVPVAAQPWPGVAQAGPGRTRELDVDDEVTQAAVRYITEMGNEGRPWAMDVGYIAPHFPLIAPQRFWDMYDPEAIDLPVIPPGHLASLPPAMRRLRAAFGLADFTDDEVRRARHGYYALCTYLDEQVGILIAALEATGQRQDTVVIYTSDHGEMAGEHGMWRKSNFYEQSVRVPLIVSWPNTLPAGREVTCPVSHVDVVASLVDLAGADPLPGTDGSSLLPLTRGDAGAEESWIGEVFSEYLAHGVAAPVAMLRHGRFKLIYALDDPPVLFDLEADPGEFCDLASDPSYAATLHDLRSRLFERWNPTEVDRAVRQHQAERLLIQRAIHGETGPASFAHVGGGTP
jgi:choline-sulfatase